MSLSTPAPLGATTQPGGVNFSVYARHATGVELLLFASAESSEPERTLELHRTADYWHIFVPDLVPGQIYAYRAHGPASHRFDQNISKTFRAGRQDKDLRAGHQGVGVLHVAVEEDIITHTQLARQTYQVLSLHSLTKYDQTGLALGA